MRLGWEELREPGTADLEIEFNNAVLPPTIQNEDTLATMSTFGIKFLVNHESRIGFTDNSILPQTT